MSMKTERGTKRTCQSAACGSRFYDLNRDPITCPVCGTIYEMMTTTAVGAVAAVAAEKAPRRAASAKKPEFVSPATPTDAPDVEADDALVEIDADDAAMDDDDDETFLEAEEDEGGDVSGIVSVPEGDEEP